MIIAEYGHNLTALEQSAEEECVFCFISLSDNSAFAVIIDAKPQIKAAFMKRGCGVALLLTMATAF